MPLPQRTSIRARWNHVVTEEHPVKRTAPRRLAAVAVTALMLGHFTLLGSQPAVAAPGGLVADVIINEEYPEDISPSVGFDGHYLYHTGYGGSTLHRINVPAAGATQQASGQVDTPIQGASSGIMTLSYDAGRDTFWAVGGDGLSIYRLSKTGIATLAFRVDPNTDRPGFQPVGDYPNEIKIAYDAADDTIWYSSDAGVRIYHYQTTADTDGSAVIVGSTPYIDVDAPPNDMATECGYSQSSGVTVGGAHLFVTVSGCSVLFEYTKTGTKVASMTLTPYNASDTEDLECDSLSYSVPVFWVRDGYDGHIRAFQQPASNSCLYGGGAAAPTPTPTPTPTPLLPPLPPLPPPPALTPPPPPPIPHL